MTLHAQPGALSDGVERLRAIIRQATMDLLHVKRGTVPLKRCKSSTFLSGSSGGAPESRIKS